MAFVVTAGQITAIQSADQVSSWAWGQSPARTVTLSPSLTMTYQQIWRAQPQLRTVVSFLARNVAQLGIDVYQRVSDTDRTKLPGHPVARLLERPYPDSKLTKYRLLNGIMHDVCIYDNAFLLKRRLSGGMGLWPVSPTHIMPLGTEWADAKQYRILGNRGYIDVDADEVIHIFGYNPDDMRQGTSPIETLRQILAEEHSATVYREQLWRNGARVAGYLRRPAEAPKWGDPARERFAADWRAQYAGEGGPQSGGTPILEDGMEFVASGVSPKDAQYVESRRLTREEVAVAYHVSPSMVGMMEGTNFSSIQELHRMLYQDTLAPYLAQISQDLECQLLEDIDPSASNGSKYIEFNLAEKLRGSFAEQAKALQSAVGGPWMTRAEARSMNNMSELEGADELIVPMNVIEGGLASPNDTAPDNPSDEGNPKARELLWRAYKRQEHVVMTRLGAGHPKVFDREHWDAELADDLAKSGLADGPSAAKWAGFINERTAAHLAPALLDSDPKAAVRGVFNDLARGAA